MTVRGPRAARPGPAGPWPVCRDREGSDSTGQVRVLAASEHEGRLSRGQASGPHGLHQQIRGRPWQSLAGAVVPSSPQGSEQPHRAPSRTGLKDTVPGDGALAVLSWQTSLCPREAGDSSPCQAIPGQGRKEGVLAGGPGVAPRCALDSQEGFPSMLAGPSLEWSKPRPAQGAARPFSPTAAQKLSPGRGRRPRHAAAGHGQCGNHKDS